MGDVRAGDLCQGPALLGLARQAVVALEHDVAFQVGVEGQYAAAWPLCSEKRRTIWYFPT